MDAPKTLNQLVIDAVAVTVTPEMIQEKVQKHVDDIVKDALREALSVYGETGKQIKVAITKALQIHDLDLPEYGLMVSQMVQASVAQYTNQLVAEKLAEDMRDMLSLAPKTIKLSEIVASMFEDNEELQEVFCELKEASYGESRWLHLSPERLSSRDSGRADIRVLIDKNGKVAAGWLGEKDLKTTKSFGNFYGLEQKFRVYYACGTVIELDEDNVTTERSYD